MRHEATITELVSGYEAYSEVEELKVSAAADAPATTMPCATPTTLPTPTWFLTKD